MNLHTKKHIVESVHVRWANQYPPETCEPDKKRILDKLKELTNPTEKEVIEIIGNKTWTQNFCDECGKDSDVTIWVGGHKEWNDPIKICPICLKKFYDSAIEEKLF